MANVEDLVDALTKSHISLETGLSFAGKGLKLNTAEDAKIIVEAIQNCENLQYLNLEGNTLGIEAAEAISKALEGHSEFKKALWKDLFTGRMKEEIPQCLQHLGHGLVTANARLVELDMSDNAFGPIGVKGLASLLKSSSCYALEILKLNNNGLGITGGKLLASALTDCYNFSKEEGKPLGLKVFIAGRNRLENEGATALAEVFKIIGTLQTIQMPQNGIYHEGITALSEAFKSNLNLEEINLNDNTIGYEGAKALSKVFPQLKNIRSINFGDCLLKTKGTRALVRGLKNSSKLEEVVLDSNEMSLKAAKDIINIVAAESPLKVLSINGNCFGDDGKEEIKLLLEKMKIADILESLSDDEGSSDVEESEDEDYSNENEDDVVECVEEDKPYEIISLDTFLKMPTPENFMALGEDRTNILLKAASQSNVENYIESFLPILLSVASMSTKCKEPMKSTLFKCCETLYKELFMWAQKNEKESMVNNCLLVHLGFIKSEDKKFKPKWNVDDCLLILESIMDKNYLPMSTKDCLRAFAKKDVDSGKDTTHSKKKMLILLDGK